MRSAPPAMAWSTDNCTLGRTLEILGERSAMIVLREVVNGVRRFDDVREHAGLPRQVLTNRLTELVDHGLLRKVAYQEPGQRVRYEYRLTDKGFDLFPIMVAFRDWGDRHLADPEGSPVEFAHVGCGEQVHPVLRCDAGHEVSGHRDVAARPGPGARGRN